LALIGIVLFMVGFLLTVSSISASDSSDGSNASADRHPGGVGSSSLNFMMVSGLLVSLIGVVIATVGPAAIFIRGKKKQQ